MGAWPPPPRSPARQQGPLRSRARAGPKREAARSGENYLGLCPPLLHHSNPSPPPLQPAPGLRLRTDLTGRDMFAVETGPS